MRLLSPKTLFLFSSSTCSASRPTFFLLSNYYSSSSSTPFSRRQEEESRNVRVSVWWDFENCNVPSGVNVFKVSRNITAAIRASGIKGPIEITAFGDMVQLSRLKQEALSATGINLAHIPQGGKNSADRSLLLNLMYWVSQNPPPAHLFLISGDRDFASILHRLRMNNYNILLASPGHAPSVLCSAASIMWHWHDLLRGENLTGKYFNQPPDGPYGSWYGHYKVPLLDPYSDLEQRGCLQIEESSEISIDDKPHSVPKAVLAPCTDDKPHPVPSKNDKPLPAPKAVLEPSTDDKPHPVPRGVQKQIHQIVNLHPGGLSITELRDKLAKCGMNLSKDYYGYKRFLPFLLSQKKILRIKTEGDGRYLISPVNQKSPETSRDNLDAYTETVGNNNIEDKDFNTLSKLSCDEKSVKVGEKKKTLPKLLEKQSITPLADLNVEKPLEKAQKPLVDDNTMEMVNKAESDSSFSPGDVKIVKTVSPESEGSFSPVSEQDSTSEVGFLRKVWTKWFGSKSDGFDNKTSKDQDHSCTSADCFEDKSHTTPVDDSTSEIGAKKEKHEQMHLKSTDSFAVSVFPSTHSLSTNEVAMDNSTSTSSEAYENKTVNRPGFFDRVKNWCKFWRNSPEDHSSDRLNPISCHSEKQKLFLKDSFWSSMESFLKTPKGSLIVSKTMTREQLAQNLQREGPLSHELFGENDLLHLIDILISEKKWVEECSSEVFPFKLTQVGKSENATHVDSSPFTKTIPPSRSNDEVLADCQKLVNEMLKEHPKGFFLGFFRKHFLEKYGYYLDLQKLGFEKLAALLENMSGVKVESGYVIPFDKAPNITSVKSTSVPDKQEANHIVALDCESSDSSKKGNGSDMLWDELGPVASPKSATSKLGLVLKTEVESMEKQMEFDYEPVLSDDDLSDSGETSHMTRAEGERMARGAEDGSSLLQILDSWYSSKGGDSCKDKSENVNGLLDFSKNTAKLSGSSGVKGQTSLKSIVRKQRPQKSYSFVSDQVTNDSNEKLVDGILGNLMKSNESFASDQVTDDNNENLTNGVNLGKSNGDDEDLDDEILGNSRKVDESFVSDQVTDDSNENPIKRFSGNLRKTNESSVLDQVTNDHNEAPDDVILVDSKKCNDSRKEGFKALCD
ncbi:uncharacterized protein LOC115714869 isoform X1 [Cannabis sativa]|uniref:uncharacterized protein LOC115714869 isoform X1 n=1 Tax=Cannabis sativa TaxID=3483 RepID=UPI0029CA26E9|nr:uncharacterized protein LOC115714869 isoform X1 [Cannabis sativa]